MDGRFLVSLWLRLHRLGLDHVFFFFPAFVFMNVNIIVHIQLPGFLLIPILQNPNPKSAAQKLGAWAWICLTVVADSCRLHAQAPPQPSDASVKQTRQRRQDLLSLHVGV